MNDRISSAVHRHNLKILAAVPEPVWRSPDLYGGLARQATQAPSARARLEWVDVAKGLGIVLVVVGHVLGGLIDGQLVPNSDWFRPALLMIYMFHMPLFFFLSGLFICERVERGRGEFLSYVMARVVWAYVLWGSFQTVVAYVLSSYLNTPVNDLGSALFGMLTDPPAQFWFLYALFLAQMLALAFLPILRIPGLLLLSLLFFCVDVGAGVSVLDRTSRMLPFFVLGIWLGRSPALMAAASPFSRGRVLGLCALALAVLWLSCRTTLVGVGAEFDELKTLAIINLAWAWPNIAAALLGLAAVVALSFRLPYRLHAVLRYLGARSMAIFALHIMAIAGSRIVAVKLLGFHDPGMLVVILTIFGVGAPLIAVEIARKFRLQRALAL